MSAEAGERSPDELTESLGRGSRSRRSEHEACAGSRITAVAGQVRVTLETTVGFAASEDLTGRRAVSGMDSASDVRIGMMPGEVLA